MNQFRVYAFSALMWCLCGFGLDISAEAPNDPAGITITLRDKASVVSRTVTLGDVAEISGGSEFARRQIGQLDLAEFGAASSVNIRRRQVEFRLRIADFPAKLVKVIGSEECNANVLRQPISEETVYKTARDAALKRLPWAAEDLSIRLVQPITAALPQIVDHSEVTMKAEPHTANVNLGRVQMNVTIFDRGERKLALPVYLEIKLFQQVALTRTSLNRGDVLSEENTITDRRVLEPNAKVIPPTEMIGRKLKRPLPVGQVVQELDLEPVVVPLGATAVKSRSPVKMIVRLGSINVVANGEALQDGKIGDRIRVQNLDSKKVIVGKVTAPDTVEVE